MSKSKFSPLLGLNPQCYFSDVFGDIVYLGKIKKCKNVPKTGETPHNHVQRPQETEMACTKIGQRLLLLKKLGPF